jgi:hypothetical protein
VGAGVHLHARFYPFFTSTNVRGTCTWQFGNDTLARPQLLLIGERGGGGRQRDGSCGGGPTISIWCSGAGVVLMIHTSEPGCTGWVGRGTHHPLVGVGIGVMLAGLLLAAGLGALGLIARSVGEMQAARL